MYELAKCHHWLTSFMLRPRNVARHIQHLTKLTQNLFSRKICKSITKPLNTLSYSEIPYDRFSDRMIGFLLKQAIFD